MQEFHAEYFDASVVTELADLTDDQGNCLLLTLVEVFQKTSQEILQKIEGEYAAQNRDNLVKLAHALKSSSASLGLVQFSERCAFLERIAQDINFVAEDPFVAELKECFNHSMGLLQTFSQQLTPQRTAA